MLYKLGTFQTVISQSGKRKMEAALFYIRSAEDAVQRCNARLEKAIELLSSNRRLVGCLSRDNMVFITTKHLNEKVSVTFWKRRDDSSICWSVQGVVHLNNESQHVLQTLCSIIRRELALIEKNSPEALNKISTDTALD